MVSRGDSVPQALMLGPALAHDSLARLVSRVERAHQDELLRSSIAPWPLFAAGDSRRAFPVDSLPQLLGRLMPPVKGRPECVLHYLGRSHSGCSRIQLRAELADWGPAYADAEPPMQTAIGARVVELASELLRDTSLATIPPVAIRGAEWPAPFTAEGLGGSAAFARFCALGPGVGQRFVDASLAGEAADAARRAENARAREPIGRGVSALEGAPV